MDAFDALLTRRSIRAYTNQPVPPELVQKLLTAAMQAPSAGNEQPWHFVVITSRPTLDSLAAQHKYGKMLAQAPLAVAVCSQTAGIKYPDFWPQDCSAATQNLLLAAHASGLGAVWLGIYPRPEYMELLRSTLRIPPEIIPFSLISLGWPAEIREPAPRFNPGRVHQQTW